MDRSGFARCARCGAEATPGWTARIGDGEESDRIVMCEHCMTPTERAAHADELRRQSREMRGDVAALGGSAYPNVRQVLERLDAMNEADALRADALEEPRDE